MLCLHINPQSMTVNSVEFCSAFQVFLLILTRATSKTTNWLIKCSRNTRVDAQKKRFRIMPALHAWFAFEFSPKLLLARNENLLLFDKRCSVAVFLEALDRLQHFLAMNDAYSEIKMDWIAILNSFQLNWRTKNPH